MREKLARDLAAARERTTTLTDLDEPELVAQHDPLMSPLVWDLAHIGNQEELWLLRGGSQACPGLLPSDVDSLYDAFEHPRASRPALPLMPPVNARRYAVDVRGRVLDALEATAAETDQSHFPFGMVVQHEQQHDETMMATLQLRSGAPVLSRTRAVPAGRPVAGDRVRIPAGSFVLGVDGVDEPFSLDNERPAHRVDVGAFDIGRVPVTNGEFCHFIDDGGYDTARWWSPAGDAHRREAALRAPMFWTAERTRRRFGHVEELPLDEPVQHVSYFEAEAYAAWAGARLPTEIEWEKACAWDPAAGCRRRWPWGDDDPTAERANLGGDLLGPAPVGSHPLGASAYGVEQLIGDVWEWTSSEFAPWPGFAPMIYDTYSEPFFGGDFRVLRGGSWAVGETSVRPSFRNWDLPGRRQIFTGFRLAHDL